MKIETTALRKAVSYFIISMQGCFLLIAFAYAFKPAILWLIALVKPAILYLINSDLRMLSAYLFCKNHFCFETLVRWIHWPTGLFQVSASVISLMGLSGVALQAYTSFAISKFPGIPMRQIFRWHYPLYGIIYVIYLPLVFLGHYSSDVMTAGSQRFEICATYCCMGMFVGFCFSTWCFLMSSLSRHNRFVMQYVHRGVEQHNKYIRASAYVEKKNLEMLMYMVPIDSNEQGEVQTISHDFEQRVEANQQLWSAVLGTFSEKDYHSQVSATYTLIDESLKNSKDDPVIQDFYACGLLMWAYHSIPNDGTLVRRWERIARFIDDIHTVICQKAEKRFYEAARVSPETQSISRFEKTLSLVAFYLFQLEKLLLTERNPEDADKVTEKLKRSPFCSAYTPYGGETQGNPSIAYALMLYNLIAMYSFADAIYTTRENVPFLIRYLETCMD